MLHCTGGVWCYRICNSICCMVLEGLTVIAYTCYLVLDVCVLLHGMRGICFLLLEGVY